jgi:DNA-binding transcriptional LysR family regulator
MEYRQILHFLTVCDYRSFSKAAQVCNISQQGLSNSIKRLEIQFGAPLLLRSPTGIEPTEFGRSFYQLAKSYASHHDQIIQDMENLKRHGLSRVSFAMPDGFGDILPEGFISGFLQSESGAMLKINCFSSDVLLESMIRQGIPLGFCEPSVNEALFEILYSIRQKTRLVVGKGHRLGGGGGGRIRLEELRGESIIILNNQRHPQPLLQEICLRSGVIPGAFLPLADTLLYRELCASNRFVSFWSGPIIWPDLVALDVEELDGIYHEFFLVRNRNVWLNDTAKRFIAWAEKKLSGLSD